MKKVNKLSAPISTLFVEDDPAVRELLYTALTEQYPDMLVYCAKNGDEGLQLFNEYSPTIIITDIAMPIIDGIQMATEIKLLDPDAIIIVLTAFSDSAVLLRAIKIGINQYLLKPIILETLFETINKNTEIISLRRESRFQNDKIRKLSMVVEQSPSSVMITDADLTIEYVNSRFTDLTGYTYSEVIGRDAHMLMSGSATMEAHADLWHTISSGFIWRGELQNKKKNNESYWISISVSPINNDDGTTHYVSVCEDITARKLAEQERESKIEFLHIVNGSTGIQDMIAAATIFIMKQSRCDAVGIRLRDGEDYPYCVAQGFQEDFVEAENSLYLKDTDGEIIRDGSGNPLLDCMCGNVICGRFDPEKPYFTAQGSFWTNNPTEVITVASVSDRPSCLPRFNCLGFESVALIPLKVGQERLGLLQLIHQSKGFFSPEEISRWERMAGYLSIALAKFGSEESLKKLNARLDILVTERTVQLEMALKEQESFSYTVSHDLRAPLRHINSYNAILLEDFGHLLPPEALNFLARSRAASQRMGNLIDDLLELSKVSRTKLAKGTVNLSGLVVRACDWLHESEPHRAVELVISRGLTARGDKSLLMQMIDNLLGNAWKYTAMNPTARIEFGMELVGKKKIFYVRDNGIGFDMTHKDMLFGAFQRLHGPEYEGNGIGLATVKRIVDRHGGEVWAEGKVNEGATFYFSL